jgi:hypothetical protein
LDNGAGEVGFELGCGTPTFFFFSAENVNLGREMEAGLNCLIYQEIRKSNPLC